MFVLFFALLIPSLAIADFAIEARGAVFFPDTTRIRRIYDNMWADYGVEISTTACETTCVQWELFNDLNYTRIKGHATFLKQRTHATIWSDHIGLKMAVFCAEEVRLYAGLGLGAVSIRYFNHTEFLKKRAQRSGASLVLKCGLAYDFFDCLFVDLFVDYIHNCLHNSVQTGGLKIGLGLGMRIN